MKAVKTKVVKKKAVKKKGYQNPGAQQAWSPPRRSDCFETTPVPDPRTPEFPYGVGEVFTVYRHDAPPPYGRDYSHMPEQRMTYHKTLVQRTQLEHCLMLPLSGGKVHNEIKNELRITKHLRAGVGCGAQVVVVNDSLVVKIFDPMYYSYIDSFDERFPVDVVYKAGSEYTRECAAYSTLDAALGGREIPEYHGSWAMDLPIDVPGFPTSRTIRLILLEYIPGPSLHTLSQSAFSSKQMSKLMVRVLDVLLAVRNHGVMHYDFSPRNVVWVPDDQTHPNLDNDFRVSLIDFAMSYVPALDVTPRITLNRKTAQQFYWTCDVGEFNSFLKFSKDEFREWLNENWA